MRRSVAALEKHDTARVKRLAMIEMSWSRFRAIAPLLMLISVCGIVTIACSSDKSRAKQLVAEYTKALNPTDIVIDTFYTSPKFPGKAYTSATVTYPFANSRGNQQREFLGFILTNEGGGWQIERSAAYTKEADRAETFLAGGK